MRPDPRAAFTALLGCLALLLVVGVSLLLNRGDLQEPHIDLTSAAQVLEEAPGQVLTPAQAWRLQGWQPADARSLAAPRRESTLWLRLRLTNPDAIAWERWLEVAPWRVGEVDLYRLDAAGERVVGHWHVGLSVPLAERSLHSRRNLLPVALAPGESRELLLRVYSENRRSLALSLWDMGAVLAQDNLEQLTQSMLLGCVLTLAVLLLLRLDWSFAMLALWLGAAYAMEAEKEGYLAFHLFSGLSAHGPGMRIAFWLVSLVGFLVAARRLLGLAGRGTWRRLYLAGIFACLALLVALPGLGNNQARTLNLALSLCILACWPLSLLSLRLRGDFCRQVLVALFLLSWAESFWFTLSYVLNRGYSGLFSIDALMLRLSVIVGIIGLFSLQQQMRKQWMERESLQSERRQNARLEEAVSRRTAELQAALVKAKDANQAKVEFLGRVSHDLRSPLTSIIGYAQLLQEEGGRGTRKAGVILRSASHMLALVNDLIDHARGVSSDQLDVQPVYIHGLLDAVAMDAHILARRNRNAFRLTLAGDIPTVLQLDAKRLRQVLINLLDNAAKFTHDGRIGLQVEATERAPQAGLAQLRFCVSDTGCGIPAEDLPKLFTPFFRGAGGDVEGTGLGLAIVEHWVQLMGGRVRVQSAPGEGTRASFELTLAVGTEQDMQQPQLFDLPMKTLPVRGEGRLVWVVEDNADIRDMLVDLLVASRFRVEAAVDGGDCRERLMAPGGQRPDLVLTDYLMPRCNGGELLRALRERWSDLPVVLMSATQQTMQSLGQAGGLPFDASLVKPISLADLGATLAQLLHLRGGLGAVDEKHDRRQEVLAEQLKSLTSGQQQQLQALVEAGAVTDLIEWSRTLADSCQALAVHLRELAETGDLDSIEKTMGWLLESDQ
ncbi:ATP-binding protein [Pseudomonas sp. JH-2]|uniref:ATP-binding protein n=1 Tax=Pseudomonas sp. JH-2 TaxID=3114998 RepID=UPI002E25C995|nr:ATP-binding protein [Pseudomonas sp. JH-2]